MLEVEWGFRRKEDGELPALGAEPEAIFASIVVERAPGPPRLDERVIDPAEARPARCHGARHDVARSSTWSH